MNPLQDKQNLSKNGMPAAWITWERQTRNRSMAKSLGVPLHELLSKKKWPLRYFELTLKTFRIVLKKKIRTLFVQNPSIVLAWISTLARRLFGYTLIVDAHNAGIYPHEGQSRFLNRITRYICRNADLTIVTNKVLADVVHKWGGKALIMPDPIPDFDDTPPDNTGQQQQIGEYVLFICTWATDEPYQEVIEAARLLNDCVTVCFTGNYKRILSEKEVAELPSNVKLLGFLPESDYVRWLSGASLTMDLTTRDNCLVCGAYESVALGVPAILSDFPVNRELFNLGVAYSSNTPLGIKKSIEYGLKQNYKLRNEIVTLRERMIKEGENRAQELRTRLGLHGS